MDRLEPTVSTVHGEFGDALQGVLEYDGEDYAVPFLRSDVADRFDEADIADVYREAVLESVGRQALESTFAFAFAFAFGDLEFVTRHFEGATVVHVPDPGGSTRAGAEHAGVVFSFDAGAQPRSLRAVVDRVRR